MPDLNDDQLNAMLREHLSRELDGQTGRAGAAFARSQRRLAPRLAAWGSLAAAAVMAVILLRPGQPVSAPAVSAPAVPAPAVPAPVQPSATVTTAVEYQFNSQTIDQGMVFLDKDTPARQYVERQVETARWVDPITHAQMELTVPHDQILLVGLNTY